jgi:hypothetical protein
MPGTLDAGDSAVDRGTMTRGRLTMPMMALLIASAWYNDPAEEMTTIFIMQRAHAGDQRLPMWFDIWTAVYQSIDD